MKEFIIEQFYDNLDNIENYLNSYPHPSYSLFSCQKVEIEHTTQWIIIWRTKE